MEIEEIVRQANDLIALPDVWMRVNELVDKPGSHSDEIGEVINCDPALTAGILKLANSSLYNLRAPVKTVSRAITILGIQDVKSLVLATSATTAFNKIAGDVIDVESYWWHSVFVGVSARLMAREIHSLTAEEMFTSGLLHDAGKLLMYHFFPEESQRLVETSLSEDALYQKENECFGFNHAQVGAELLRTWNLPESLWVPIQHHHQLSTATTYQSECAIVFIANAIAHCVAPGYRIEQPETFDFSHIPEQAWEWAGIDPSIVQRVISGANAECLEILEIISPGSAQVF